MKEKFEATLNAYCETRNEPEKWSVVVAEHEGRLRAVVTAEHFARIVERQADVWAFLRTNVTGEECARISTIQTVAPGEGHFGWKE